MESEAQSVFGFFDAYRQYRQVAGFFDAYRKALAPRGRLPEQNFLHASGIIRQLEVNWCCVLRWLLDPQTCRLSVAQFQHKLCKKYVRNAVLERGRTYEAEREVRTEDGVDRYDIILSAANRRIVIEAKVNARYDVEQHTRYDARRTGRADAILYVVRHCKDIDLSRFSSSKVCEWSDIADLLKIVLDESNPNDSLDERRWRVVAIDFIDLIEREA